MQDQSIAGGDGRGVRLVGGCRYWPLQTIADDRGKLTVAELDQSMPFEVRRVFFISLVPPERSRGGHAHRWSSHLLMAVGGAISMSIDDGSASEQVVLDDAGRGLLIPPMVWSTQDRFAPGSALIALASHPYDENEYIRSYDEFRAMSQAR